jgi:hypothetical protein
MPGYASKLIEFMQTGAPEQALKLLRTNSFSREEINKSCRGLYAINIAAYILTGKIEHYDEKNVDIYCKIICQLIKLGANVHIPSDKGITSHVSLSGILSRLC